MKKTTTLELLEMIKDVPEIDIDKLFNLEEELLTTLIGLEYLTVFKIGLNIIFNNQVLIEGKKNSEYNKEYQIFKRKSEIIYKLAEDNQIIDEIDYANIDLHTLEIMNLYSSDVPIKFMYKILNDKYLKNNNLINLALDILAKAEYWDQLNYAFCVLMNGKARKAGIAIDGAKEICTAQPVACKYMAEVLCDKTAIDGNVAIPGIAYMSVMTDEKKLEYASKILRNKVAIKYNVAISGVVAIALMLKSFNAKNLYRILTDEYAMQNENMSIILSKMCKCKIDGLSFDVANILINKIAIDRGAAYAIADIFIEKKPRAIQVDNVYKLLNDSMDNEILYKYIELICDAKEEFQIEYILDIAYQNIFSEPLNGIEIAMKINESKKDFNAKYVYFAINCLVDKYSSLELKLICDIINEAETEDIAEEIFTYAYNNSIHKDLISKTIKEAQKLVEILNLASKQDDSLTDSRLSRISCMENYIENLEDSEVEISQLLRIK